MKEILLAGDSVCLRGSTKERRLLFLRRGDPGYFPFVEKILDKSFKIHCLPELGGTSENLLHHIDDWMIKPHYDIIHFNCGLHDIKRWSNSLRDNYSNTENIVHIEKYRENLEKIIIILKEETISKIIWATTTAVIDERHNSMKSRKKRPKKGQGYLRYNRDVLSYNKVAEEIMTRQGVPINDLYRVVEENGRKICLDYAGVHLTVFGCDIVSKAIEDFLVNGN